jgi:predicted transcriptional regulator
VLSYAIEAVIRLDTRNNTMNEQTTPASAPNVLELTADVVSAFISKNQIAVTDLPALISQVHATLTATASGKGEPESQKLEPAVPTKNSVKPDYIICLEDGKKFKSLKRHLRSSYNLTPEEYRKKWGLKHDYPMVAPAYAAKRSELAKSMGLGHLAAKAKAAEGGRKAAAGKKGSRKKKPT